ncbi:hypothetical protein ACJX0J_027116, partial [Zea mays]
MTINYVIYISNNAFTSVKPSFLFRFLFRFYFLFFFFVFPRIVWILFSFFFFLLNFLIHHILYCYLDFIKRRKHTNRNFVQKNLNMTDLPSLIDDLKTQLYSTIIRATTFVLFFLFFLIGSTIYAKINWSSLTIYKGVILAQIIETRKTHNIIVYFKALHSPKYIELVIKIYIFVNSGGWCHVLLQYQFTILFVEINGVARTRNIYIKLVKKRKTGDIYPLYL